ncbi:hypothetical protein C7B61_07655 [filamentous cyanobacterium CCP1]|nr:hypothetical protein C7B76_13175 [filamentous cyanobacterium CCP2]PSB67154.1 hypothetical protein C7B61_07655 [filamentous cyanobacterium CCP1]
MRLNYTGLIKTATGFVGAATLTVLMGLPGLAQTNPTQTNPTQTNPTQTNPAQTNPTQTNPTQTNPGLSQRIVPSLDNEFIIMAAQGNNAEIMMSELALERSDREDVRAYAERMIQEHTQANRQLEQIAAQQNMVLPQTADPLSMAVMQQLTQLSGEEFDLAYIGAQANAHLRAIGLYRTAIQQGQEEAVRSYASQLLPSIAEHYEMASIMLPEQQAEDVLRPIQ